MIYNKTSNGCVYLIADYNNEVYKIGVSRNCASKRMKQLQTGNSNELTLLYTHKTEYPYRLESILHNRFKFKQIHNEWFALDNEDIKNFDKICEEIDKTIQIMKDNPFFSKNLH